MAQQQGGQYDDGYGHGTDSYYQDDNQAYYNQGYYDDGYVS